MADRLNIQTQLEHLQARYVGTGHADTNKFEWVSNQQRDSLASHLGHPGSVMCLHAIASNEAMGRVQHQYLQKMLQPCGKPPVKEED